MSVVLLGSTSGSITLQEPAVAGTTVLDLPATSGTFITTGSSGQSIPKAALPTGSVLQVVSGTTSTAVSTTSTSYIDTGVTVTITPLSATSKIFVIASALGSGKDAANDVAKFRIVRTSTQIAEAHDCFFTGTSNANYAPVTLNTLDSPATTSATTYKLQIASGAGSAVVINANSRSNSTITVMEIAA